MAVAREYTSQAPARGSDVRCPIPACRALMGTTDGQRLYLGTCSIERLVTLHCTRQGCGGHRVWRPASQRNGTVNGTGRPSQE